jgi:hypothetical protein
VAALDALVEGRDTEINRVAVGARLDRLAESDPAIRAELEALVQEATDFGMDVASAAQVANGDYNQMINNSPGASNTITGWLPPSPPRV